MKHRLHYVDALRGLAALSVIAFHLIYLASPPLIAESGPLFGPAVFGATGVYLFFVISGFSLEMTMYRHDQSKRPFSSYLLSRAFRILPLFYTLLFFWTAFEMLHGGFISMKTIALNLTCLFNLAPGRQEGMVAASWTIGVEVLFYAAFPILHRLRSSVLSMVVGGSALLFGLVQRRLAALGGNYDHFTVLGWVGFFLIGMLVFRHLAPMRQEVTAKSRGGLVMSFALLLLAGSMLVFGDGLRSWLRVPIALGYAALLLGAGMLRPRLLELGILRFYGRISYSVYLLHAPLLILLRPVLRTVAHVLPPTLSYLVCYAIALAVITPTAWLTYRLIEAPAEGLGRALIARLGRRQEPSLPASA